MAKPALIPVAVLPLGHVSPRIDPWRTVLLLMAITVVAQGATAAVPALGYVSSPAKDPVGRISWTAEMLFYLGIDALRMAIGIGLVLSARLVLRGRPLGQVCIPWLELALPLLSTAMSFELISRALRAGVPGSTPWQAVVSHLVGLPSAFAMPLLTWLFSRRPEVRRLFDGT